MQLTQKDISEARRLAKCLTSGNIPVNQLREFLERVAEKANQQPKPRKVNKSREVINYYKSIL